MKIWTALLLILSLPLLARESYDEYLFVGEPKAQQPWFTGPLLTPSGHVVPEGHQNYEPYVYYTQEKGTYNAHWSPISAPTFTNVLTQVTMQFGVLTRTEFNAAPQFSYNHFEGKHMWRVSDIPVTLAFQLLYDEKESWYPGIKLRLSANVPLGKYDHLSLSKRGTDIGGIGSWFPGVGLVFTRVHHVTGIQYLSWRLFFDYSFGTPTNVKGLSVFGGAPTIDGIQGTRGTVRPGNVFLTLLGLEYSLTQNWCLALDVQYQHNNKRRFSGTTLPGTRPTAPSRELFAIAPAVEYNWSSKLGVIAGPWFTVAGRNSPNFISYVVAINIYN